MNEIDIKDIIVYLKSKASLIIYSTMVIAIVSVVVSLNLKQIYRSEALVTIASDNLSGASQMSGGLSGLSSLASFAGISIDESADSKKTPSYVVAKINSLSFFRHLSSFDGILEGILAQKSFNPKTGQIIYDQNVYVVEKDEWKRPAKGFMGGLKPTYIEAHNLFLGSLYLEHDKKTGFITMTYDHTSPFFAQRVLSLIVTEVNNLQKKEDLAESEEALEYLLSIQSQNKVVPIERSLASLIGSEMQRKMLASIKDNYLIEYIDEPVVAESRISPRRTLIVMASTILGFFSSVFLFIFYEFVYKRSEG